MDKGSAASVPLVTKEDVVPALKILGRLTLRAIDSLPLPLLVMAFLVLLALTQWPRSSSSPLLPAYSPSSLHPSNPYAHYPSHPSEKSRLSPSPLSPPSFPSWPRAIPSHSPVFYPSFDPTGKPQYTATLHTPDHSPRGSFDGTSATATGCFASGATTPPRRGSLTPPTTTSPRVAADMSPPRLTGSWGRAGRGRVSRSRSQLGSVVEELGTEAV